MRTRPVRPRARSLRLVVPVLLALALTAACGDEEAPTVAGEGGDDITHPTGPDELVLRVAREGGFLPVGQGFAQVPPLSVYGGGRVIVEGPQIEIFPPPALPNLLQRSVTDEGLQAMLAEADDAGLLDGVPDYGQPPIADATTTVVTIHAEGDTFVHSAYALMEAGDGGPPGLTEEQRAARTALADFVAAVLDPEGLLPEEALGPEEPYVAPAFAVWARPVVTQEEGTDEGGDAAGTAPADEGIEPQVVPWPLAEVDLDEADPCLVVDGDAADVLREALTSADTLTRFEQDATVYEFSARPLLPDEPGCP